VGPRKRSSNWVPHLKHALRIQLNAKMNCTSDLTASCTFSHCYTHAEKMTSTSQVTVVIRFGVFSTDLTYPFLNFRVGAGQRGIRIKGVKCIVRNPFLAVLFRIAGIPVVRSWEKRGLTVFTINTFQLDGVFIADNSFTRNSVWHNPHTTDCCQSG